MSEREKIIGIAHAGDLGAAIASLLIGSGRRVIVCAEDRSDETRARSAAAGCEEVATFADLVAVSDVFISVVPPAAVLEMAEQYARVASKAPANAIYVDVNSISPQTAQSIAQRIEACGVTFV